MAEVNLLSEQLLSLKQAAKRVPGREIGECNPTTVLRWVTRGAKLASGRVVKLEAIRLAGRWLTSAEALERFLNAQNEGCHPDLQKKRGKRPTAAA